MFHADPLSFGIQVEIPWIAQIGLSFLGNFSRPISFALENERYNDFFDFLFLYFLFWHFFIFRDVGKQRE